MTQKTKEWLYRLRWNRSLQLALVLVLVIPGAIVSGCIISFRHFGQIALERILLEAEERSGYEINSSKRVVNLGSLDLENLTILGAFENLSIDRIHVDFSLNPFSSGFLKIKEIDLNNIDFTANDTDPASLQFASLVQKLGAAEELNTSEANIKYASWRMLFASDARIAVRNAAISIKSIKNDYIVSADAFNGIVNPFAAKVSFFSRAITFNEVEIIPQIKGSAELLKNHSIRTQLSAENNPTRSPWSGTFVMTPKRLEGLSIKFDSIGVPNILGHKFTSVIHNAETLAAQGTIDITTTDDARIQMTGNANFSPLSLSHPLLTDNVLGPFVPGIKFAGSFDTKSQVAVLQQLVITLNKPTIDAKIDYPAVQFGLSLTGNFANKAAPFGSWSGIIRIPPTSCQTALQVAPFSAQNGFKDFVLTGNFALDAELRFEGHRLDQYFFQPSKSSFTCQVLYAPREYSADYLRSPFHFIREQPGESTQEFYLGEVDRQFVPIQAISRNLVTAIVSSEDAGFWFNDGIDFNAIDYALRNNLKNNKVIAGGSTITMQLVKNLFLTQKRNLARKTQELFLAWHLNNSLPKNRILEIYLNIIEFGPGIYGIKQAASHFFGKSPQDLTLKESVYLASVLPSPIRRYRQFCNRKLSPGYEDLIDEKIGHMYWQGRIPYDVMAATKLAPLVFSPLNVAAQRTCMKLNSGSVPKKA